MHSDIAPETEFPVQQETNAKPAGELRATATGQEKAHAFVQWAKSHRETPPLSDEAVSRASLYPDRW